MVSRKWLAVLVLTSVSVWPVSVPALTTSVPDGWREAPELARMFTPRHVPAGSYHAYVSDLPLDAALAQIQRDPTLSAWPDAWQIDSLSPGEAFGQGASYDRWGVARLYGGTPARVARGPRMDAGQTVEAWTLMSPYPDAALKRLEPGTLLIVLKLR